MKKALVDGKQPIPSDQNAKDQEAKDLKARDQKEKDQKEKDQKAQDKDDDSSSEDTPGVVVVTTDVNNAASVGKQVNAGRMRDQYIYFGHDEPEPEKPVDLEVLADLPPTVHPFRDPRHEQMLRDLQQKRVLLLTSYQEHAAYSAAYTLIKDTSFSLHSRKTFFPARGQDRDRSDLDLITLTRDLDEKPQIVLIDIRSRCTLLDSTLILGVGPIATVCARLKAHSSFLILAVNEDLLKDASASEILPYSVSHLLYLLSRDLGNRAPEFEKRLLAGFEAWAGPTQLSELYQRVADRLPAGEAALEALIQELERARTLPPADRKVQLEPIKAADILREESAVHRAAAFLATYFTNIRQQDFDRLVLLLLGEEMITKERTRRVTGKDGFPTTVTEETKERWSERWARSADLVFRDCHLRTVDSSDGSWVVDFSEPYLRRELRVHFDRHLPWYVKRQCQVLQESGVLFAFDLSPATVEGLVDLFVERAVVDPQGFGSRWLLELVHGLRIQFEGEPPSDSQEKALAWLLAHLAMEARLLAHFHGRLALMIREMLDRDALRPMVDEFFEFLIAARQHGALLDLIVDLARRLRFVSHFEPLIWMRRLLDQGSDAVRERAADELINLARDSGPRIYEFLTGVRDWLPQAGLAPSRFSPSNQRALEFLFAYCARVAESLSMERMGAWPSQHPLFYTLSGSKDARSVIVKLIDWILDRRGLNGETEDSTEKQSARVVQIAKVAALVEHWSWVLQGRSDDDGSSPGGALFVVILEEIVRRADMLDRARLQRSWRSFQQGGQQEAMRVGDSDAEMRAFLVARRNRLSRLRTQFAEVARSFDGGMTT